MAKLHKAAIVAAMVGSVCVIGAGTASAHDDDEQPTGPVTINCTQNVGSNTASQQYGLINVQGPLLGGGDANASANQQLCGLNNEDAENEAGEAEGGLSGLLGLEL